MSDVIKNQAELANDSSRDVLRILKYINAMNYGLGRLNQLPLSENTIKRLIIIIQKEAILLVGLISFSMALPLLPPKLLGCQKKLMLFGKKI